MSASFERKFKHYTGFTPKEYSRIVKFKNAVELLRTTTSANLLTTAVDAGYYDLAHFSKEIKSMSGNTPASFLSLFLWITQANFDNFSKKKHPS